MSQSTRTIDLISSVRHCVDEDLTDLSRYLMQHSFFTKAVVTSRTMVVHGGTSSSFISYHMITSSGLEIGRACNYDAHSEQSLHP